jgi:hypothetical protein
MRRRTFALGIVGLVLAACGSTTSPAPPSAAPSTPPQTASPAPSTPAPSGGPATAILRATESQAILPIYQFGWLPIAVITSDGRLLVPGAVPAIAPGPLVAPIEARTITPAGVARILAEAKALGLLSGASDFSTAPGDMPLAGGKVGRLQLVVDGVVHDITGDPSRLVRCDPGTRCPNPTPGTPEVFAAFWARLGDLPGWLGPDVGAATPGAPVGYAILVGPPPAQPIVSQPPVVFPLPGPLARFGAPVLTDATLRCGSVGGTEAELLRPALEGANPASQWVDDEATSATFGLTVRPLMPGDGDPCEVLTRPAQ